MLFRLLVAIGAIIGLMIPTPSNAMAYSGWHCQSGSVSGQTYLYCWYDEGFGGGGGGGGYSNPDLPPGGGGGTAIPVGNYAVPEFPNDRPATCETGVWGRYEHAAVDAGQYSAARTASGQGLLRPRDVLTITYDDGATEQWRVRSAMTFGIIEDSPIPGTLRCP